MPFVARCAISCIEARFAHFEELMRGRLVASLHKLRRACSSLRASEDPCAAARGQFSPNQTYQYRRPKAAA